MDFAVSTGQTCVAAHEQAVHLRPSLGHEPVCGRTKTSPGGPMRTGKHPQATVLDGCIIKCDPCTNQRPITRGDEPFVLVPRLTLQSRRFEKKHRLHALHPTIPMGHVRTSDRRHHRRDPRMLDCVHRDLGDPVGKVNRKNASVLGHVAHRIVAFSKANRISTNCFDNFWFHQPRLDQEPVIDESTSRRTSESDARSPLAAIF